MAPSNSTTSTPPKLVVTLPPTIAHYNGTLRWHPAMAPYDCTQQWHHVHCTLHWHPGATSNPPKWFVALNPFDWVKVLRAEASGKWKERLGFLWEMVFWWWVLCVLFAAWCPSNLLKTRPLDDLSRPHPAEWVSRSFCITCAKMDKNALHHQWRLVSKANVGAHWSDLLRPWSLLSLQLVDLQKGSRDAKTASVCNKTQRSSDSVVLGRFVLAASKTSRLELHQFVTPSLHWSCLSYLSYLSCVLILPWRLAFRVHFYNSYSAKRKMVLHVPHGTVKNLFFL